MKELVIVAAAALVAVIVDLVFRFRHSNDGTTGEGSPVLFVAVFVLWVTGGLVLIDTSVHSLYEFPVRIGFLSLSFAGLAYLGRRFDWQGSRYVGLALLPLLTALMLWEYAPPFRSHAWLAWLTAAGAHLYILNVFAAGNRIAQVWHGAGLALTVLVGVLQLHWFIGVTTWENAAISLVLSAISVACLVVPFWPEPALYRRAGGLLAAGNLVFLVVVSLVTDGDPMPLAYRPLLNPYDIAIVIALAVAALAIRFTSTTRSPLWSGFAILTLGLLSLSVMRATAYLTG